KAWVVHGSDGLDEVTTTGPTWVSAMQDGKVENFEIHPEDAGLALAQPEDLKGGDPETNAKALSALLDGAVGPYRDVVLLNAAATLVVADKADDLRQGVEIATESIDSGKAKAKLSALVSITNEGGTAV
ncbi:MAG: anthranilate phosphoribosyltransferase, partial [Rhodospirillaceae bacterium]|nr:anthranilate phosphoribosyltransferase [Rhodospirillaceae bacterium]